MKYLSESYINATSHKGKKSKCECCGSDTNCKELSELDGRILCEKCFVEFSKDYVLKIYSALEIAAAYGGADGEHHKNWVIDQMIRILAGERYEDFVKDTCSGEDGPDTYRWDVGIAP